MSLFSALGSAAGLAGAVTLCNRQFEAVTALLSTSDQCWGKPWYPNSPTDRFLSRPACLLSPH